MEKSFLLACLHTECPIQPMLTTSTVELTVLKEMAQELAELFGLTLSVPKK